MGLYTMIIFRHFNWGTGTELLPSVAISLSRILSSSRTVCMFRISKVIKPKRVSNSVYSLTNRFPSLFTYWWVIPLPDLFDLSSWSLTCYLL